VPGAVPANEHFLAEQSGYGDLAEEAVKQDGLLLQFVASPTLHYEDVAWLAVRQNGMALQFVDPYDDDLGPRKISRFYYGIVLAAVEQNGMALQYARRKYRGNRNIVTAAVRQNREALQYASDELKQDPTIAFVAGGMKLRLS